MAEYKFLSESETEEEGVHQYELEVKADLGEGDVRTHVQTVVFKADECQEKAQEYADAMEKELTEARDADEEARKEAEEASKTE